MSGTHFAYQSTFFPFYYCYYDFSSFLRDTHVLILTIHKINHSYCLKMLVLNFYESTSTPVEARDAYGINNNYVRLFNFHILFSSYSLKIIYVIWNFRAMLDSTVSRINWSTKVFKMDLSSTSCAFLRRVSVKVHWWIHFSILILSQHQVLIRFRMSN